MGKQPLGVGADLPGERVSETSIQWTDYTFNPWWGCTRVSPGCEHCYAETFSHRLGLDVWGPTVGRRFFADPHWREPLTWAARRAKGDPRHRVFCASMADVFEDRDDLKPQRQRLFELILKTPELTWQLLTKRPQNARRMVPESWERDGWPANVWFMFTAEDQENFDSRWPHVLTVGAICKGLSYEPALGPLDLQRSLRHPRGLDWVIVGGESGHGARPFDVAWARSTVRQCREAGVACFVKQMGRWVLGDHQGFAVNQFLLPDGVRYVPALLPSRFRRPDDAIGFSLGDPNGGDMAAWSEDLRVREFPA